MSRHPSMQPVVVARRAAARRHRPPAPKHELTPAELQVMGERHRERLAAIARESPVLVPSTTAQVILEAVGLALADLQATNDARLDAIEKALGRMPAGEHE